MSDLHAPMVFIKADTARIKSYSAADRGKAMVIKMEIHVDDAWQASLILSSLQECKNWTPPTPPKPERARKPKPEPLLALPAPAPRLTYGGDHS